MRNITYILLMKIKMGVSFASFRSRFIAVYLFNFSYHRSFSLILPLFPSPFILFFFPFIFFGSLPPSLKPSSESLTILNFCVVVFVVFHTSEHFLILFDFCKLNEKERKKKGKSGEKSEKSEWVFLFFPRSETFLSFCLFFLFYLKLSSLKPRNVLFFSFFFAEEATAIETKRNGFERF